MVSIITAVFGQLEMNKLFYESLEKYTSQPFELIIIDNTSTDGSREFFESKGAKVIPTGGNYSYPYCQNLGMQHASHDFLAFLNNDMVVCPGWDVNARRIMEKQGLLIASCSATDGMPTPREKYLYRKGWSFIKKPLLYLFGPTYFSLKLMHKIVFPNWEAYTRKRFEKYGDTAVEGFAGCNILAFRKAFDIIGPWDNRVQAADYDLFMTCKRRSIDYGDIKPIHILAGIYLHHYIRLTLKSKIAPPKFTDSANIISPEDKWGMDQRIFLLKDAVN